MDAVKYCLDRFQHHHYAFGRCIRCGMYQQGTQGRMVYNFWRRTLPGPNGCIIWHGRIDKKGYGVCTPGIKGQPRNVFAHRMAWYLAYGQWPANVLDHLCRVPLCVNVAHLEDVTQGENIGRGIFKAVCKNGHEQTPKNRYTQPKTGKQRCRLCLRKVNQ